MTAEESLANDKTIFLHQKCMEAENASKLNQSSKVYSIIRDITRKSTVNSAMLVNKRNGEPPFNKKELIQAWGQYFKELLNITSDLNDVSHRGYRRPGHLNH